MRVNLAWLCFLFCAVALMIGYSPRSERILSLRLLLAQRPIALSDGQPLFVEGDCFRLALHLTADGSAQMSSSQRRNGLMSQGLLSTWSAPQWSSLERGLWDLPGWREKQCDGGEPEGQVLYTWLEVETQHEKFCSHWRGLPKPQAEVLHFLLKSPAGDSLRQGLAQLRKVR